MNYFELFNLPVAPTVDKSLLSKKYFELQKKYHPDFFSNNTEEEKEMVVQQSADVNKAYKIFQNKEKTIEYFLQQKGLVEFDEKYTLPPDFLMEMMELNEALDENNAADIENKVKTYEENLYASIQAILENYEDGITPVESLKKLKDYYFKKKYLERILDRLDD
ncbi:MAG: Fe-S protein assembly co-chaperone HscB [Bacteroidetes bacterium]|nr:Fe-S protein assembly co-chaperone HscB [Bacteroidota bacterium]